MLDLDQKIPSYLYEKKKLLHQIIYTAAFALLFINLYQPFGSKSWYPVSEIRFFAYTSLVILSGVLIVAISRVILYFYARQKNLFIWQYLLWIMAEILVMSGFYTLVEKWLLNDAHPLSELARQSLLNTSLILLLPYSTSWLYYSWKDKLNQLDKLMLEEGPHQRAGQNLYNFLDDKRVLRFSVQEDRLLWIEAADNYVKIFYLDKGKISSFLIRNSLKILEQQFIHSSLIRCNRSTMVNFNKVKLLRKDKKGIFLALDCDQAPDIPVSKTYADKVLSLFSTYSS
jgi:hypothetical protein